jgi:hypothetical protein
MCHLWYKWSTISFRLQMVWCSRHYRTMTCTFSKSIVADKFKQKFGRAADYRILLENNKRPRYEIWNLRLSLPWLTKLHWSDKSRPIINGYHSFGETYGLHVTTRHNKPKDGSLLPYLWSMFQTFLNVTPDLRAGKIFWMNQDLTSKDVNAGQRNPRYGNCFTSSVFSEINWFVAVAFMHKTVS